MCVTDFGSWNTIIINPFHTNFLWHFDDFCFKIKRIHTLRSGCNCVGFVFWKIWKFHWKKLIMNYYNYNFVKFTYLLNQLPSWKFSICLFRLLSLKNGFPHNLQSQDVWTSLTAQFFAFNVWHFLGLLTFNIWSFADSIVMISSCWSLTCEIKVYEVVHCLSQWGHWNNSNVFECCLLLCWSNVLWVEYSILHILQNNTEYILYVHIMMVHTNFMLLTVNLCYVG